jgi:uncharacterized protein (TIGR02996 family)
MARNLELEAAILVDPENEQRYRDYADWLEENGDLHAQLIRAQLAERFGGAARMLLWEHGEQLLGPVAKFEHALHWKNGFVEWANLSERTRLEAGPSLEALLAHRVGAFLRGIEIYTFEPAAVIQPPAKTPPTLRFLRFFSPTKTVSLSGLAHVFARLKKLVLDGMFELVEPLDLPLADELAVELDALSTESAAFLANGTFPLLQGLTIGLARTVDAQEKLAPLFARDLPRLEYLVIAEARESGELDDMCELLVAAPFAGQLTGLELDGTLGRRGVEALRDSDRLIALKTISVKAAIDRRLIATLERSGCKVEHDDPSGRNCGDAD